MSRRPFHQVIENLRSWLNVGSARRRKVARQRTEARLTLEAMEERASPTSFLIAESILGGAVANAWGEDRSQHTFGASKPDDPDEFSVFSVWPEPAPAEQTKDGGSGGGSQAESATTTALTPPQAASPETGDDAFVMAQFGDVIVSLFPGSSGVHTPGLGSVTENNSGVGGGGGSSSGSSDISFDNSGGSGSPDGRTGDDPKQLSQVVSSLGAEESARLAQAVAATTTACRTDSISRN
ncbi:MAG: hypothetical protein AB7K24_15090 [Gemmataceae bacterium]